MAVEYKTFGQSNPGTTLTDLYTVPSAKSVAGGVLVVTNTSTTARTFRMAISMAGASIATAHYHYYDFPIPPNDVLSITGITMSTTDVLRVYGSTTDVTFNFSGALIT